MKLRGKDRIRHFASLYELDTIIIRDTVQQSVYRTRLELLIQPGRELLT